jgi:excisionase family DNA binding protein
MTDCLLTTRELAERLGLSPATVLRRWRAGEIPGYRLGSNVLRFAEADVDAYLLERRRGGFTSTTTSGTLRLSTHTERSREGD